jgi:hypothetical protein
MREKMGCRSGNPFFLDQNRSRRRAALALLHSASGEELDRFFVPLLHRKVKRRHATEARTKGPGSNIAAMILSA